MHSRQYWHSSGGMRAGCRWTQYYKYSIDLQFAQTKAKDDFFAVNEILSNSRIEFDLRSNDNNIWVEHSYHKS